MIQYSFLASDLSIFRLRC